MRKQTAPEYNQEDLPQFFMHPPPSVVFRALVKNMSEFTSDTWLATV